MYDPRTAQVFERLSLAEPRLREWLLGRRDQIVKALVSQRDETTLRQAQGQAQMLDEMLALMQPRRHGLAATPDRPDGPGDF